MSGQAQPGHHKVRRNVSPSQTQRQGPLKAVQAFSLIKGSPTRSPSSPVQNVTRRSQVPENIPRSPGPGSPSSKAERSKPRLSPASSSLRRTGSLDTIGPYLKGQWPVDIQGSHSHQATDLYVLDKGTQTPENWHAELTLAKPERRKKKKHRRSASFGHGDRALVVHSTVHSTDKKLEVNRIRQILQKKKDQGTKPRESPITGNHNALSMTAPAVLIRSAAIGIPSSTSSHIPKTSLSRPQRNSVEGLNIEIEKFSFMTISGGEHEELNEIPDGHRAPVPEIVRTSSTRNVDTQTPSGIPEGGSSGSPASQSSRPQSLSPAIPIIPGLLDNSPRPPSCNSAGSTPRSKSGERDSISPDVPTKMSSASPKPNKIVREPPDGCEMVAFDEDKSGKAPAIKEPLLFSPIQGRGEFLLKPSIGSAFCPLAMYSQSPCFSQTTRPSTILESQ